MKKYIIYLFIAFVCLLCVSCANADSEGSTSSPDTSATSSAQTATGTNDFVAVAQDENYNYGYINTNGQWVIAPQYAAALSFSDGYAAVYNENIKPHAWQIIDKSGNVIVTFDEDIRISTSVGYNDNSVLSAFLKDSILSASNGYISEGMMIIYDRSYTKFGFAAVTGQVVVEPKYAQVQVFSEGLAAVNFGTTSDGKWGYIDAQGNTIIAAAYEEAHTFSCGLAYVEWKTDDGDTMTGFIDKKGQLVIYGTSSDNVDKYGVPHPTISGFNGYVSDFVNDLAVCQYGTGKEAESPRLAVINKSGVAVWIDIEEKYWVPSVQTIGDDLFHTELLSDSEKVGFLDTSGAVTVAFQSGWKCKSFFSGGLCKVTDVNTGKYGYIDRSGAVVIPLKYSSATPFLNGYAIVSEDGKEYSYIDAQGNKLASGDYVNAQMPFTK